MFDGGMPKFGEVLRRLRKQRRLSQDELGAAAGLNGQTISNIETGKIQVPRGETYRNVAKGLGMTIAELDAAWGGEMVTIELPRPVHDALAAKAADKGMTVEQAIERFATGMAFRYIDRDPPAVEPASTSSQVPEGPDTPGKRGSRRTREPAR